MTDSSVLFWPATSFDSLASFQGITISKALQLFDATCDRVLTAAKHHLQELSNELGLPIQVAHYPVHCSKYNPIERREFSHVERAFSGRIFSTASDVAEAAESTSTQTGLNITTAELPEFQPVRKSGKRVPKPPNVEYDKDLPDYNYTFNPQ